jgi:hypothetical protein
LCKQVNSSDFEEIISMVSSTQIKRYKIQSIASLIIFFILINLYIFKLIKNDARLDHGSFGIFFAICFYFLPIAGIVCSLNVILSNKFYVLNLERKWILFCMPMIGYLLFFIIALAYIFLFNS